MGIFSFNRTYSSQMEGVSRLNNFAVNYQQVQIANLENIASGFDTRFEVGIFGDWSAEERQKVGGLGCMGVAVEGGQNAAFPSATHATRHVCPCRFLWRKFHH
jgi:hypothetical protein